MDQDEPHHLGEVAVLEAAELHVLLQEKDPPVNAHSCQSASPLHGLAGWKHCRTALPRQGTLPWLDAGSALGGELLVHDGAVIADDAEGSLQTIEGSLAIVDCQQPKDFAPGLQQSIAPFPSRMHSLQHQTQDATTFVHNVAL